MIKNLTESESETGGSLVLSTQVDVAALALPIWPWHDPLVAYYVNIKADLED